MWPLCLTMGGGGSGRREGWCVAFEILEQVRFLCPEQEHNGAGGGGGDLEKPLLLRDWWKLPLSLKPQERQHFSCRKIAKKRLPGVTFLGVSALGPEVKRPSVFGASAALSRTRGHNSSHFREGLCELQEIVYLKQGAKRPIMVAIINTNKPITQGATLWKLEDEAETNFPGPAFETSRWRDK